MTFEHPDRAHHSRWAKAIQLLGLEPAGRIGYLDGWRGVAISMVLIGHYLPIQGFYSGRLGVDLFFCLSGVLMAKILFLDRVPLKKFYKRRASRIFPVFIAYVLVVYSFYYVPSFGQNFSELFFTLTFLRTYWPGEVGIWDAHYPIEHLWSLNVEEHSYMLLSLVALCMARSRRVRPAVVLLLAAAVMMVVHWFYIRHPDVVPINPEIRTEVAAKFIFLSAGYFLACQGRSFWLARHLVLPALVLGIYGYAYSSPWWMREFLSPLMLAFAVCHLPDAYKLMHRLLALAPLRAMGVWSYSIYLWQQLFLHDYHEGPASLALAMAIAVGVASFVLFENPVRSFMNRRW